MPAAEQILDGCHLIRVIGSGGFGEVWLCRLESTGEFKALKFLPASGTGHLERELEALIRYRKEAGQLQCSHLVPIEHVNGAEDGLFYTMPLSDGLEDGAPSQPTWRPKTLSAMIEQRRLAPTWFLAAEIYEIMTAVLAALQSLSEAGMVHRDVKPENVLFIGGRPCLGDISLLTDDRAAITRRGTPHYTAPSWYLDSGGNPDMWGAATTLFRFVTGQPPDKLGRAAFLWPPQGEKSLSQSEREAWHKFHRVILRATRESAAERFLSLRDMSDALSPGTDERGVSGRWRRVGTRRATVIAATLAISAVAVGFVAVHHTSNEKASPARQIQVKTDEFDMKLAVAKRDFEALLNESRTKVFGDALPKKEKLDHFKALLLQLKNEESAPLPEVLQKCAEIEAAIPGVEAELAPANQKEFSRISSQLFEAAGKPMRLASTADENFRGERMYGTLIPRVQEFMDDGQKREMGLRSENGELHKLITAVVTSVLRTHKRADGAEDPHIREITDRISRGIR